MTTRTVKNTKPAAKQAKRLSPSKKALKDLTARGKGPLGGVAEEFPFLVTKISPYHGR